MFLLHFLSILRSKTVSEVDKDSYFKLISNESLLRVVQFFGKDCPACTATESIFDELSRMYWLEHRIKFAQMNCDLADDVCGAVTAYDFPSWLVWFPSKSLPRRYNRDFNCDSFVKFIRQQTGIYPFALENNLLYEKSETFTNLKKRNIPFFGIVDLPRMNESQELHYLSREIEKRVLRGIQFVAFDKTEDSSLTKLTIGEKPFGCFIFAKGKFHSFSGNIDSDSLLNFIKSNVNAQFSTPTPVPTPYPDYEDYEDEEFVPEEDIDETKRSSEPDPPKNIQDHDEIDDDFSDWEE